jgi:hypothetical protein
MRMRYERKGVIRRVKIKEKWGKGKMRKRQKDWGRVSE